jgi:hypothetical protein
MVLGSGIREPGSGIRKKPIPDLGSRIQGSKRHRIPDPGSGSATLVFAISGFAICGPNFFANLKLLQIREYIKFLLTNISSNSN